MTRRVPRYFTRRPAPKPWRPFLDALEAYGVTEYVPETATLTHGRDGIVIDVMVNGDDGYPIVHDDTHEPVVRRRFFPHPDRPVQSRGRR